MSKVRAAAAVAVALVTWMCIAPYARTQGSQGNGDMERRLGEVKKSAAANMESLHHYTWLQKTTLFYKGEIKNVKDQQVKYGPDGKLVKTLVSSTPEAKKKPGLRGKVVEKKVGELKDYMERVGALIEMYVPPVPAKIQAAYQAGNVMFGNGGQGLTKIEFKNYVTAGDLMTMNYDFQHNKLRTLNVSTLLDEKDPVTLAVVFKMLPDNTNYAAVSTLNAEAKKVEVKVEAFDYKKVSP